MLCVFNSVFRVVDALVFLRINLRMEPKLHFVKSAREPKERHVSALDHTHEFLVGSLGGFRVVGGDRHEWFESFN